MLNAKNSLFSLHSRCRHSIRRRQKTSAMLYRMYQQELVEKSFKSIAFNNRKKLQCFYSTTTLVCKSSSSAALSEHHHDQNEIPDRDVDRFTQCSIAQFLPQIKSQSPDMSSVVQQSKVFNTNDYIGSIATHSSHHDDGSIMEERIDQELNSMFADNAISQEDQLKTLEVRDIKICR
jgi:hypothetical protein